MAGGKISRGDIWKVPPADDWNNALAAGEAFAAGRLQRPGQQILLPTSTDIVQVRNDTGQDMARGEVLCLDDFILTALDPEYPWFAGELPTTDEKPYGVLLDPIPHQASGAQLFGRVQMSGVCIAKINMVYADHRWCHIATGEEQLQTDWHGSAEILHKEEISEQWWALVRMSNYHTMELYGETAESIAAAASGDFDVWYGGAVTDPLQTITVYFDKMASGTVPSGTKCLVRYFPDENHWSIVERQCS